MYDKIFISHSSKDKKYAAALVNFLEDIGLRSENIFCTSIAEYGVPLGDDFNKRIKGQFYSNITQQVREYWIVDSEKEMVIV